MAYSLERKDRMKRISIALVIILSIIMLSACDHSEKQEPAIQYESGIYDNKNWDDTTGTYNKGAVIPDAETAVRVATAIYDSMEKSKTAQEFVAQYVFYDEADEVWIVSFFDTNPDTVGMDCSIAIQKVDGKVLRIWFGE